MVLKSLCRRHIDHEKDVSAQQHKAQKNPWVSGEDRDQGWPAGAEKAAGKGSEEAEREWLGRRTRGFPGNEELSETRTSGRCTTPAGGSMPGRSYFSHGPMSWDIIDWDLRSRVKSAVRYCETVSSAYSGRSFADSLPTSLAILISSSMPSASARQLSTQSCAMSFFPRHEKSAGEEIGRVVPGGCPVG
jgi:hypothetical protein